MLLRRNRDVRMEERQGLTRYPRPSPTQLPSCPNFKFFFTVPIFTAVCSHKCFSLVFICLLKFQDPWQYLIGADLFCFCFFLFFPLFHTVIGLKKTHTFGSPSPPNFPFFLPGWSHPPHHISSFIFALYCCPCSQMNLGQSYFTVDTNSPEIVPESWALHMNLPMTQWTVFSFPSGKASAQEYGKH